MNEYNPGDAVRFSQVVTVLGVLTSIAFTFEIRSQDGSVVIPGTVVRDTDPLSGQPSTGSNYSDVLIPMTAPPGRWRAHWQATGVPIDANRNVYREFVVRPLPR